MMFAATIREDCDDEIIGYLPRFDEDEDEDRRVPRRALKLMRRCTASITPRIRFNTLTAEQMEQFHKLTREWKRETEIVGNLSKIVMHPSYQRIMAMGRDVIPYILQDLARAPGHWFWALHNLIEEGQDPAEGQITIAGARNAWLEWGRKWGIISKSKNGFTS